MIMQLEHISKSFGGRQRFHDVTFRLEAVSYTQLEVYKRQVWNECDRCVRSIMEEER